MIFRLLDHLKFLLAGHRFLDLRLPQACDRPSGKDQEKAKGRDGKTGVWLAERVFFHPV